MQNKNYSGYLDSYDEAEALQQLVQSFISWQSRVDGLYAKGKYDEADNLEFSIIIAGIQTSFCHGGPTVQALTLFITSLASELCLSVDFNNGIVTENKPESIALN